MGVGEVDNAFMVMIDMSAELLNIGRPEVPFEALKRPEPVVPKSSIDFEMVTAAQVDNPAIYHDEYLPLQTELKRFEPEVLLFSSLEPGQGVSFSAGNIARLWGKETSEKVLLLEFYNGSTCDKYNNPVDEDAEAIRDAALLEEYLVQLENENVYVYSVRSAAVKEGFAQFWEIVKNSFDLIIIDSAPLGFNIMTEKLFSLSTGVIMITAHKPDPVHVQFFEKEVKENDGRFLGVVLNAIEDE